jgi:hypothetical protein
MATTVLKAPIFELDLWLKQGADADVVLTVVDKNGAAITNFAGYTARAQIRAQNTTVVLFEWNSSPAAGQGSIEFNYDSVAHTSTLTLSLTGVQSALFTFGTAQWDCFFTNPAAQTACVAEGTVTIDPRFTY